MQEKDLKNLFKKIKRHHIRYDVFPIALKFVIIVVSCKQLFSSFS